MWSFLKTLDAAVSATRPAWGWGVEVALVWLGCHLAADRLDDAVAYALTHAGIAWPEPDWPLVTATWTAVVLELTVALLALRIRFRGSPEVASLRMFARRLHPAAVADPLFLAATSLAGTWALDMAVEDTLAPWWPTAARPVGLSVAVAVAVRFAVPSLVQAVRATPIPRRRTDGWAPALLTLPFAWLAVRHGWPVWGLLP